MSRLGQLSKRLVQATALTFSLLVVIPSFTQTASADSCGYSGGCVGVIGDRWDPWDLGDSGEGYDPYPPGCDYIGCESEEEDDGDYDPPEEECSDGNSSGGNKNGDEQCDLPDPNITCDTTSSSRINEVRRLYIRKRDQIEGQVSGARFELWLHSSRFYDVEWSNGELGQYYIDDSSRPTGNNTLIYIIEDQCD